MSSIYEKTKYHPKTITTDNGSNMLKAIEVMNRCEIDGAYIHSINSIKCVARTLQLAMKEFMQSLESVEFIEKTRKIVKLLGTPSLGEICCLLYIKNNIKYYHCHRYLITKD